MAFGCHLTALKWKEGDAQEKKGLCPIPEKPRVQLPEICDSCAFLTVVFSYFTTAFIWKLPMKAAIDQLSLTQPAPNAKGKSRKFFKLVLIKNGPKLLDGQNVSDIIGQ